MKLLVSLVVVVCSFSACLPVEKTETDSDLKLVLQITVDGLRKDLLDRYRNQFVEGGFNRLLENGVVYTNAHYEHANTETIVGHTTLSTGTFPAVHGMVGNVWYDRESGEIGYNIEDPLAPILPSRTELQEGAQVDPAQLASRTQGRSPRAILSTTIADEIFKSSAGKAKIFGISGKDRSAVAMAGHTGKAFWYSSNNGDFITSQYYYQDYPDWVKDWNQQRKAEGLSGTSWELLNDLSTYMFKDQDDRSYEIDLKGYGKVFPHPFGDSSHPLFATRVLVSPMGDQLTLDFAKTLIKSERIGVDDITDYLSISFSGVDAVNHFFGPSSLENEDVVLQLDRTLKALFDFIDTEIGLQHTLIILSADHGMAEMPEYMDELGYQTGRMYTEEIMAITDEIGMEQFGIDGVTKSFFRPSLYLDENKIQKAGLSLEEVATVVAEELTKIKGIAKAVSAGGINPMEQDAIYLKIKNNYHPNRSGDIYVAQDPYWFLYEKSAIGVMHGSPWNYDTHVPIIFAGVNIDHQIVERLVNPTQVAPTIATLLGVNLPSSSELILLEEVFD